jgi:hypothetical protein
MTFILIQTGKQTSLLFGLRQPKDLTLILDPGCGDKQGANKAKQV